MRNISEEVFRKKENKESMYNNFFSENPAVYEIMLYYIVELDRPQMTIRHTRVASWVSKATNTHSEFTILIVFPFEKWLHESASMLGCT
jgi:BarA-like signal transduction histidine kinase